MFIRWLHIMHGYDYNFICQYPTILKLNDRKLISYKSVESVMLPLKYILLLAFILHPMSPEHHFEINQVLTRLHSANK